MANTTHIEYKDKDFWIGEAIRNMQDFGEYIPTTALQEAAADYSLLGHRTIYKKPLKAKRVLSFISNNF